MGNVYKTKEEVTKARDKQLAIVKVNDYILEKNEGWFSDWRNNDRKYCIYYAHKEDEFYVDCYTSREFADSMVAIKNFGITRDIIEEFNKELRLIWGLDK